MKGPARGKRAPHDDIGSSVATASYIIPKRPRTQSDPKAPSPVAIEALNATWQNFEAEVHHALCILRRPLLDEIVRAIKIRPKGGEVVAVCIKMGAAAVAGDRSKAFESIVNHIQDTHDFAMLCLQSANHSSMSSITQEFEDIGNDRSIVVALKDADLFPEETLRDIVYLCGKYAKENSASLLRADELPPVSLMFGLGTSATAVHSALGVQEATMIVPTMVEMPNATACFSVIVDKVLAKRIHTPLLSQPVYDMIQHEFFSRESTIAMVMRSLHQMLSFHFLHQPLAVTFCNPLCVDGIDEAADTALDSAEEAKMDLGNALTESQLHHIKTALPSVRSWMETANAASETPDSSASDAAKLANIGKRSTAIGGLVSSDDELRQHAVSWYLSLHRWKKLCSAVEAMFFDLLSSDKVTGGDWKTVIGVKHSELRLHVFRSFLLDGTDQLHVKQSALVRIIFRKVSSGQRPSLLEIIRIMLRSLTTSTAAEDLKVMDVIAELDALKEELENPSRVHTENPEAQLPEKSQRRAKGGAAARQARMLAFRQSKEQHNLIDAMKKPRETLTSVLNKLLDAIIPFNRLPMYECVLFEQLSFLKKASGGMGGTAEPRSAIFAALRKPSTVLGGISERKTPDTAIAYRLLAEGGRMVNLYDWYNNFATVRSLSMVERDDEGNIVPFGAMPDAEVQARFAKACSELEFLGLLKYTNRKTDHVLRLVFE